MQFEKFVGYWAIILITLCSILAFSGCARYEGAPSEANISEENPTSNPQAQTTQYQFPDLPVPVELNLVLDESTLIRTPNYQGGIITYKGRVTSSSLEQFFLENLPKHGWNLQGSLTGKGIFLAFSKDIGAQCLIKIKESPFTTKVEIWLSEPLGATE